MLDGLLGRGFSSKCKSLIKATKTRIDVVRRKRNAMQRFLKKDIAELLANGLDINAYGRAEGLYVELNLSSCYDSVEQFCGCIPLHLSAMQKQNECPEECKEAVSSLMFAAARFADLPELRELRDLFSEKYGKSLDSFVNQEFVQNLASNPPTTDKKLQLMREIAKEFSIKWDFKAFEQKMSNPPAPVQEQPKGHRSFRDSKIDGDKVDKSKYNAAVKRDNPVIASRGRQGEAADGFKPQNGRAEVVLKREKQEVPPPGRVDIINGGYTPRTRMEETVVKGDEQDLLSQGRRKFTDKKHKPQNGREETNLKRDKHDTLSRPEYNDDGYTLRKGRDDTLKRDDMDGSSRGRRKHADDGNRIHTDRDETIQRKDNTVVSSYRKPEHSFGPITKQEGNDATFVDDNQNTQANWANSVATNTRAESLKPQHKNMMPPPYVIPNGGKYASRSTTADHATSVPDKGQYNPPIQNRDAPNGRSERTQTTTEGVDFEHRTIGSAGIISLDDKNYGHHQDDLAVEKKPKPRSVRRRHLKPPSGHDLAENSQAEEVVRRKPSGRRREDARQGLQHVLDTDRDQRDEEERMMDKLLVHYSKKPTSFEPPKEGARINAPPSHHDTADNDVPGRHRSRNGVRLNPEPVPPPTRAISLPPEPVHTEKMPARATSFQQDLLNPGPHVHPKLPDYDDLAARFAALKGR